MSKAIVIGYLAKVSAANVNASHTEGNVVVAKKKSPCPMELLCPTSLGRQSGECCETDWKSWVIRSLNLLQR